MLKVGWDISILSLNFYTMNVHSIRERGCCVNLRWGLAVDVSLFNIFSFTVEWILSVSISLKLYSDGLVKEYNSFSNCLLREQTSFLLDNLPFSVIYHFPECHQLQQFTLRTWKHRRNKEKHKQS